MDGYITRHQWIALHAHPKYVKKTEKRIKPSGQPKKYEVRLAGEGCRTVFAFTKGEARAVVKRELNLNRLPVDAVVTEV